MCPLLADTPRAEDDGEIRRANGSVAIEVGLRTVGLAPAIFSPWMNISGSILANYWSKRPVKDAPTA